MAHTCDVEALGALQVHGSSCTLVVPGILLVAASMPLEAFRRPFAARLCVYRQMTEDTSDLPLTGFLATILLSMLPLMALKADSQLELDRDIVLYTRSSDTLLFSYTYQRI